MLPEGRFHGGDVYAYRWLAKLLPYDGAVVELGPYMGRSICSIAEILRERRCDVTVIDKFVGLPADSRNTETVSNVQYEDATQLEARLRHNLAGCGLRNANVIAGNSSEQAIHFADQSLDMVFIDADHQHDAVLRDLAAWWPKIKPTGRIAGHDYTAEYDRPRGERHYGASGGYSVAPAIREFFELQREVKRVPRQQQTTVWYVNRDASEDLVLSVMDEAELERSLRTHVRPESNVGIIKRQRVLEIIRELGRPTREHAIFTCADDPVLKCHLNSSAWYITQLLRSQHLTLVPRMENIT